jgi:hypothetical protein
MSQQTSWRCYEEVAQYLLSQIAAHFSLGSVEGKQIVAGASGTDWEIDAKCIRRNDDGFVIVECRRHTKRGVPQEEIRGLAFRIRDTGAVGGIIVSPLPLQSGAKIVAKSQGIQHIQLSADSTTTNYVLQFLNKVFVGVHAEVAITAFETKTIGKVISTEIKPVASLTMKINRAGGSTEPS